MDTREVLEKLGVEFKKDVACCPFHNEKTGSFRVWKKTNKYKCFGCGESGDALSAVMKLAKKGFSEAVEYLADMYNVRIEHENTSKEETEEKRNARQEQFEVVAFAHKRFQDCLMRMPADAEVWQYLESRGYSRELAQSWNLGFAPDDPKFLTTPLINSGKYVPSDACGIISTKEGVSYDFFRNRIIIPIYNSSGIVCGFGGRALGDQKPKYLNSPESPIYQKQSIWYGIDRAAKSIKKEGFVYVVEGYFDVMSLQNAEVYNTVAACGTAITEAHVKHLKRYTDHVVLCQDGDAAGYKAMLKTIDLFLMQDFKVEVVELPDGKDPDDFVKFYLTNQ
jgi:DNA primase